MVMKFVLHPLPHYNSITKPHAQFLLSLIEDLTIEFPFHFILSLIDVYKDMVTHDKLIFPSTIMRIIHHYSVSYLESPHFTIMCAISAVIVQLRLKQPRIETATPPAHSTPSTFAPSSSVGGVTLEAVMTQLQRMDARLDTLTTEMYQVNTRVGRITRQQACLRGFIESPSPSLEASEDKDDDGDSGSDADEDASSFGDDEMIAS